MGNFFHKLPYEVFYSECITYVVCTLLKAFSLVQKLMILFTVFKSWDVSRPVNFSNYDEHPRKNHADEMEVEHERRKRSSRRTVTQFLFL